MPPKKPPSRSSAAVDGAHYLTAHQASQFLRVKVETLYAYVSRGLVRTLGDRKAGSLYLREDIERLRARGQARTEHGLFKGGAPRWAEPIVQSLVTEITREGPRYRGRLAVDLDRQGHRFENVSAFLWSGVWVEEPMTWEVDASASPTLGKMLTPIGSAAPDIVKIATMFLAGAASFSPLADDLRGGNTIPAARHLLTTLPATMGYLTSRRKHKVVGGHRSIASAITAAAGIAGSAASEAAINSALVLLADHELTPQAFGARVAASNGSSLYSCLLAALCIHSGSRIRQACDKIEDWLISSADRRGAKDMFAAAASSRTIPGFNHPLYPAGDPRADRFIEIARSIDGGHERGLTITAMLQAIREQFGQKPNAEAGLVALCYTLGLPYRSPAAILLHARFAGWTAHVIEQRLAGTMLRPRARYTAEAAEIA